MATEEWKRQFRDELRQFTGSDNWYRHGLNRNVVYTDGVKFLAEKAGAYWLIDEIAIHNMHTKAVKAEEFQVWKLLVISQSARLTCDDGNGNIVFEQEIEFTDFSLDEIELWFENNTLYLPSER